MAVIQNCFYNLILGGQAALSCQIAGSSEVLTLSRPQFSPPAVGSQLPTQLVILRLGFILGAENR